MINTSTKNSFIVYFSRPVRVLLGRFSFALLIIVALAGVFVSKNNSPASLAIRGYVVEATAPIVAAFAVPFNFVIDLGEGVQSYFFVRDKNILLEEENNLLKKRIIKMTGVIYENDSLKRLLHYVKDSEYKYISTRVVGNSSDVYNNSITINAGVNDGIKKGQAVINEYGLVGRVIEVYNNTSRVLLITDINSNIPVMTNKSRENAIMSGNNTNNPHVIYLPIDSKTNTGEVIVTSGDGGVFPSGLQIGIINKVSKDEYYSNIFVDLSRLEYVSVIDYLE